jgi:hypothetical protein
MKLLLLIKFINNSMKGEDHEDQESRQSRQRSVQVQKSLLRLPELKTDRDARASLFYWQNSEEG